MTKTDATKYKITEIKGGNRYWFNRDFVDAKHGRNRKILVALEKAGWLEPGQAGGLAWNLSIEDRGVQQTWKLLMMKINGEDKYVFERFSKTREGVKGEIFNLAFLPSWVTEEISQVTSQMAGKELDGGVDFLRNLVNKIEQEKTAAKADLSAKVEELSIGGLSYILSPTHGDERGSFREVARFPEIELLTGYDFVGKQVNHSMSSYGTLRGLHVEPWAKLVTVVSGFAVSVLLDCRPNSRTYGKTETVFLGYGTTPEGEEIKGGALFIEPGIANSVLVLSPKLDYNYVVDDIWRPDTALFAVNPMDPKLGIDWGKYVPLDKIIRSDRDKNSQSFAELSEAMKKV